MAYIGNAKTPLLLATNVRDELIPDNLVDGNYTKKTFDLSQEVPGGDEANVTVVRRRWIVDNLVSNTSLVQATNTTLTVTDKNLAAALSIIQPKSLSYEGDTLLVSIGNSTTPTDTKVLSVVYTVDQIQITLDKPITSGSNTLTLTRGYYAPWEILDYKTDYRIGGTFGTPDYHKKITLVDAPQAGDLMYVMHRGDATYNMVPSPSSVGLDQLSDNLKSFVCNRGVGNDTTTDFEITQTAINERSLLVTVGGIVKEGDDLDNQYVGDWKLVENTTTKKQYVRFHAAPANGDKIQIIHMGFVAGLRRAAFAPGQEPGTLADRSVGEAKLTDDSISTRTIQPNAITTQTITNNAVTSSKLLLDAAQNEGVRTKYAGSEVKNLIGVVNQTSTEVYTKNVLTINFSDTSNITASATEITPSAYGVVSLGSAQNKFDELHLSGQAILGDTLTVDKNLSVNSGGANIVGDVAVTGNETVSGNISVAGTTTLSNNVSVSGNIGLVHPQSGSKRTVDGVVLSDLKVAFDALVQKVSTLIPVGTIMLSGRQSPQTLDGVWLVCDGSPLTVADYPELHAAIGYTFGGSGTSFNLPDLQRRTAIGKSSTDSLGASDLLPVANRNLTHTHSGAPHTHDLSNHTHTVFAHYHSISSTSTLAISISGGHDTRLDHSHSVGTTTTPCDSAGAGQTLDHTHTHTHTHAPGTALSGGKDHIHTGATVAGGGTHTHTENDLKSTNTGQGPTISYTWNNNVDGTPYSTAIDSTNSGHTHSFTTNGAKSATNPTLEGYLHTHPVTIPEHTGTTSIQDAQYLTKNAQGQDVILPNKLSHHHRFTVPALENFVAQNSPGTHIHGKESFSGLIGVASSKNGDVDQNSNVPEPNATGGAVFTNTTGSATNTPHLILNYVIKAKNN